MQQQRWLNPAQPQTLQFAVFLLYFNSAFLLYRLLRDPDLSLYLIAIVIGQIAAGYGIANERKWGYGLGLAMAVLNVLLPFFLGYSPLLDIIGLMFDIALVALLLHPQSRDYQRIWFK